MSTTHSIVPADSKISRQLSFRDPFVDRAHLGWERGDSPAGVGVAGEHIITLPLSIDGTSWISAFLVVPFRQLVLTREGIELIRLSTVAIPPPAVGMRTVRISEETSDLDARNKPLSINKIGGRPSPNNFSPEEKEALRAKQREGHRLLFQLGRSGRSDFVAPGARPLGNGQLYVFVDAADDELSYIYSP